MQETEPQLSRGEGQDLLRLRAFCFPGGEQAARGLRAVRTIQKGEIRMSAEAPWIPFSAEEFIDSTRSSFRWEARLDPGKLTSPTVTDAYEEGHGRLVVKVAGLVPIHKVVGPDADKGELQRYFASIALCPSILLNHHSLNFSAPGPGRLRVCDRKDTTGATVDLEVGEDGRPVRCRAERPRIAGKQVILTPWTGDCDGFREWEGIRVATRLEVRWHLTEGLFTYYRSEITSFTAVR